MTMWNARWPRRQCRTNIEAVGEWVGKNLFTILKDSGGVPSMVVFSTFSINYSI